MAGVEFLSLLKEFGVNHCKLVLFYCDNRTALYVAANPVFYDHILNILKLITIWFGIEDTNRDLEDSSSFHKE